MADWTTILCVFLGGGTGSVARWAMMNLTARLYPGLGFPLPTLAVNVIGAFLIGLLLELLALRLSAPAPVRFLLVTGFLGGFTTFSAFSLDCALLVERGGYAMAAGYIALSVLGTIAAVFAGSALVRVVS